MSPPESHASVLAVDDDPAILSVFRRLTRRLPVKLLLAHNAEQALILVEAEHPVLVISDYEMPGMDGLTLLRTIKAKYPQVECVLHTGNAAQPAGEGIPVLAKPSPPELLQGIVALAAARHSTG